MIVRWLFVAGAALAAIAATSFFFYVSVLYVLVGMVIAVCLALSAVGLEALSMTRTRSIRAHLRLRPPT
jgi:hypothetical protein